MSFASPFAIALVVIFGLSLSGLPVAYAMIGGSILYLLLAGLDVGTAAEQVLFAALEKLEGAPGRIEIIGRRNGGAAFVDYAHKPGALETAIAALRPFATGRLIVVFGCGGDRDTGKREIMGEISARDADITIVTDDNPRSEQPQTIRAAILSGAHRIAGADVREIGDRGAAIAAGVALLGPGDILLVAGKGHETGQIVGSKTLPFSDHEAVRAALGAGADGVAVRRALLDAGDPARACAALAEALARRGD